MNSDILMNIILLFHKKRGFIYNIFFSKCPRCSWENMEKKIAQMRETVVKEEEKVLISTSEHYLLFVKFD